jgi:hypothetical protein
LKQTQAPGSNSGFDRMAFGDWKERNMLAANCEHTLLDSVEPFGQRRLPA